jgi:hypothetical protein
LPPFSPEKAAKSQRLGAEIGVPAPIIDLDPEGWQKRIADQKNAGAIKTTPELQGYVLKDPTNAKVSRDDMVSLAKAADTARTALPVVHPMSVQLPPPLPQYPESAFSPSVFPEPNGPSRGLSVSRLGSALVEGFGGGPFGIDPTGQTEEDLRAMHIFGPGPGQQAIEALVRPAAGLGDIFLRLGGATISGAAELAQQFGETVNIVAGQDVIDPVSFGRAIGGVAESEFARQGAEVGVSHTPAREAVNTIIDRIKSDIAKTRVVEPGSPPPKPLAPEEVDAIARQAIFNALFDSVEETATKSRSPSSAHDFTTEAVKDATVAVPVESVQKLYAEKGVTPAAGDGMLGFTPDIADQVERAKLVGGDIKVPMAGYLAHADKTLHESLQGDLRVGEGLTVNEAKVFEEQTKQLRDLKEEKAAKAIETAPVAPVPFTPAPVSRDITKPLRGYSSSNPPPVDRPVPDVVFKKNSFEDKLATMVAEADAKKAPDTAYRDIYSAGAREVTARGNPKGYASWRDMSISILEREAKKIEPEVAKAVEAAPTKPVEPTPSKPTRDQTVQVIDKADAAISDELDRVVTGFVGHGRGAKAGDVGIMQAHRMEEVARGNAPDVAAKLEETFAPVREELRSLHGDNITLYRVQEPVVADETVTPGSVPGDRKRAALSWTADPAFAKDYAGAGEGKPVIEDTQITALEKEFEEKGEVKIPSTSYTLKLEDGAVQIYDPSVGGHVTDTDSVRAFIEEDVNAPRLENKAKAAKNAEKIITAEVPLNDVIWATNRANQTEFIVKNYEGSGHFIDNSGKIEPTKPVEPTPVKPAGEINVVTAYHGSIYPVEGQFDPAKTRLGRGVFFTDDPKVANDFALNRATDSDPAMIYPDDGKAFEDWVNAGLSKPESEVFQKKMDRIHELEKEDLHPEIVDDEFVPLSADKEAKSIELNKLLNEVHDTAREVSAIDYGTATVTKTQVDIGKSYTQDMGGRFDWDKERTAIEYAKANGYDSVTLTNVYKNNPSAKIYTVFDKARIAANKIEPTKLAAPEVQPVTPFEGDMVVPPSGPSIPISEVTEADFSSRFSINKSTNVGDTYTLMKDNRPVGSFRANLDPADPTTIRVTGIDVPNSIDRPGAGDQRKLLRELQRDFPTATHVQGERLGGTRVGTNQRVRIPKPEELVRRALHIEPLFQDAAAAGMTEREFKLYSKNLQDYQEGVATKKREVAERNARREYRTASEAEKKKAGTEFDDRQDVTAEALLRAGNIKLNDSLVDKDTVPRGLTAPESKGGVAPDDIAGALGYNTGSDLLRALEGLHQDRAGLSPKEYRDSVVERAVKENVPEVPDFTDEAFSEPLSKLLFDDMRVMQRQTEGAEGMPPLALDELKARASRIFSEMPVKEATNLREWEKNVRENGRQAELALLSGDVPKAFKFKNQQLFAHLFAREAIKFSREFAQPLGTALRAEAREARRAATEGKAAVEEALLPPEPEAPQQKKPTWTSPTVLLKRYNKAKPPKNIGQDFIDQIQGILQQHGVPLKRDGSELGAALRGKELREFVKQKNDQGANIQVADFVYDSRTAQKLSDMTVDNHREIFRSIRSLDHAGREEMSARKGAEKLALEELEGQIVDNLNSLEMTYKPESSPFVKAIRHLRYQGDALLVRPEQMLQDMDRRDPLGPLTQSVNKLLQDGKHWENDLHKWATDEFRKFPEIERAEELIPDVPFTDSLTSPDGNKPGRPYPMKRIDAIMTAVQMGNDSSAEMTVRTLLGDREGYLTDLPGSDKLVRDWLEKNLSPKDWDFVEAVWGLYDKIKPLEDLVYERTSGVAPRTLEPTPWNGHSGGYFPIIQDPMGGDIASKRGNSPFDSHFRPTATSTKHAKERTGVFMPVTIVDAYHGVPGDVRARLHAVAMKEAIDNAHKILSRPKIIEAMNKHYGKEYTDQLGYWLQEIANHWNQDDAMLKGWAAVMRGARKNLIISTLSLNANVILSPNVGPFLKQLFTSPGELRGKFNNPEWNKFVIENSGEIRHRMENIDRDMRTVFADAMGTRSKFDQFKSNAARWGMYLAVKMDTKLAMLAWDHEYTKAMETGQTFFYRGEPKTFTHEQAVDAADQLVRLFFGSHSTLDLPGIMRQSEAAKTFGTMFYGFQNVMYGRTRDVVQLSKSRAVRLKEGDLKGARSDFSQALAQSWMFIGLTAAFGYLYSPKAIDDDLKKGAYGSAGAHLLAGQLMSIIPGLRDVGAALLEGYPVKASPMTEAIVQAWKAGKDILYKDAGEPSTIKDLATAVGLVLGVPGARQFGKSAQYMWNATHGHDSDKYFTDWVRGLLYGKAKP